MKKISTELDRAHNRRGDLVDISEKLLDAAEAEDRDLTSSEQALLDSNRAEIKACDAVLNRAGHWGTPADNTGTTAAYPTKGHIGVKPSEMFAEGSGTAISETDFFSALATGHFHPEMTAIAEGSGAAGGHLVPTPTSARWLDATYENSIVLSRATVFPMTSETLKIAGFDSQSAADGVLFGGQTWAWIAEGSTNTVSDPTFRKIELKARKLGLWSKISNEVGEDAIGLAQQLETAMIKGASWVSDYAFLNGTGTGQPLGILKANCLISVDAESGQDADTIVYENLISMHARCAGYENAIWIANHNTLPQLASIVFPGTLGGWPIWNSNASEKVPQSIFGRPLIFTEKLPTLGDEGDICLCDFSQYAVGLRRELSIEKSAHVRFMQDETTWRGILRIDGQPLWNSVYTPHTGNTLSPFVTLAAR